MPENPQAFPSPEAYSGDRFVKPQESGMTLRDYFAAKAMEGFLANPANVGTLDPRTLAAAAYGAADAMLAAREATP